LILGTGDRLTKVPKGLEIAEEEHLGKLGAPEVLVVLGALRDI
jgi:hypothetical protein